MDSPALSRRDGVGEIMKKSDRPLTDEERDAILQCCLDGLNLLGVDLHQFKADGYELDGAPQIQRLIYEAIPRFRQSPAEFAPLTLDDTALTLGSLWGEALCASADWEWAYVTLGETQKFCVLSEDRSHLVFPHLLLKEQLEGSTHPTTLLLYNMIKDGGAPPAEAGAYMLLA